MAGLSAPPTERQLEAMEEMRIMEERKIRDLFVGLSSEGFRQFLAKTAWDPVDLTGKTCADALTRCDELFGEKKYRILALVDLYTASKKPRETYEEFVVRLRHMARDCQLGDQEDRRIMEALVIGCRDKQLLKKILDAHPDIPTLAQVLGIVNRHESTVRETQKALGRPLGSTAGTGVCGMNEN
ncbi:MAG: hypothetical protein GY696_26215 [Gammaproteobacteria bacterium]|nr:hypothetical protein [Gammaproteobacteria bacterium]